MGVYDITDNMSAAWPQEIINRLSGGSETLPSKYSLPRVLEYVEDLEAAGHTWLTLQELCRKDIAQPWCCGGNCEYQPGYHAVFREVYFYPHRDTVFPARLARMVTESCNK